MSADKDKAPAAPPPPAKDPEDDLESARFPPEEEAARPHLPLPARAPRPS
jgi:hypothetical protein